MEYVLLIPINPHLHVDADMLKPKVGFTLIEIIVVISIMTILLGVGTVSYNYFNQQKSVEKDAEFIRDKINITRERAVNRDIAANTGCVNFDRYELSFNVTSNPQSFTVTLFCTNPNVQRVVDTFNLDGSRVINPNSNFVVQFISPYGCTNASCNAASRTIIFENNTGQQCISITIDALGKSTIGQSYAC